MVQNYLEQNLVTLTDIYVKKYFPHPKKSPRGCYGDSDQILRPIHKYSDLWFSINNSSYASLAMTVFP